MSGHHTYPLPSDTLSTNLRHPASAANCRPQIVWSSSPPDGNWWPLAFPELLRTHNIDDPPLTEEQRLADEIGIETVDYWVAQEAFSRDESVPETPLHEAEARAHTLEAAQKAIQKGLTWQAKASKLMEQF
ncbi:hypothetical protein C8J57DRAFT_1234309 [Mycena rebaudengoi]|nr:hypothetical protein C8J57DRAFT_1234309 [Mycena rebaudengoi]